jgi:hypothetical protein
MTFCDGRLVYYSVADLGCALLLISRLVRAYQTYQIVMIPFRQNVISAGLPSKGPLCIPYNAIPRGNPAIGLAPFNNVSKQFLRKCTVVNRSAKIVALTCY